MVSADELIAARRAELDEGAQRRLRSLRRVGLAIGSAVISLVMIIAVLDGLDVVDAVGVDDHTVTANAGDLTLSVRHPSVARPALAAPFEITVSRPGGFDGPVRVAVDAHYLEMWDLNGVIPAPAEEISAGDTVIWEFTPPEGDVLRIRYEARIEPARQEGGRGRVAVMDGDADELVAVELETRLRP